ncbi:inositol phosphorylceramide synthase [Candidatus Bathyarchaeota archaeon]|nr:inositol phosphorylceramide synthase [Candidatus Bathyarchaeota archaeon]
MQKKDKTQTDGKASFAPSSSRVLAVALPAIYLVILTLFCITYNIIPGPEFLILCFFIYAAYSKRSKNFLKDWLPFLTIFVSYQAMYSLVGAVAGIVHVSEPITAELQLFGSIPTVILQQLYRMPILDYMGAVFYSLHFFAPTIFGFYLWKTAAKQYYKYTIALAILTYSALITFLVFPVAPPWYGVNGVTRILFDVDASLGVPVYRTLYDFLQPNQFAAFPSLHSALPWLIALYGLKIEKIKALPILAFPFGVWFSAVYLGEHYIVDIIGGIAYATIAFIIAEKLIPYIQVRRANRLHGNIEAISEITVPASKSQSSGESLTK